MTEDAVLSLKNGRVYNTRIVFETEEGDRVTFDGTTFWVFPRGWSDPSDGIESEDMHLAFRLAMSLCRGIPRRAWLLNQ